MLTWSGDVVVHVVKSVRWNLLFVLVCGDAVRSCCTFSCYKHCGIEMKAWMTVASLVLHEVASNLLLGLIWGSKSMDVTTEAPTSSEPSVQTKWSY